MMNDEVDNQLVERLKSGDERVFAEIYSRYFPIVSNYIKISGGKKEDAQDVFSDALVTLYQYIQRENFFLSGSLSHYLVAICKRKWLVQQRINKKNILNIEGLDIPEIENSFEEENENLLLMRQALTEIETDCKRLLECYASGYSMQEIADMLHYRSEAAARKALYRCRNHLRAIILTYHQKHR